jgi:myo-inositol-1(or 4)-monophosphatase
MSLGAPFAHAVHDSARLMDVAVAAATSVGDDLRAAFRSRPDTTTKRDRHDLVTVFDTAAEDAIRDRILAAVPDSVIVGEEGGTAGSGEVTWYVDPIDGTSNFVHGVPFFCTAIAAVVDNTLVAAAVYDPTRDDLFTASLAGAWCNGQPLRSEGATDERHALLMSTYPHARDLDRDGDAALRRMDALIRTYRTVRVPGSAALSLTHVAAGWTDAALGIGVNPWDVAAGALMVAQAGGTYLGVQPASGGREDSSWLMPGFLATVRALDPVTIVEVFADGYTFRDMRNDA